MKCLWVVVLAAGCVVAAWSQGVQSTVVREFPEYRVYPGTLDEDNFPVSGARLCTTEAKPRCFTLAHSGEGSDKGDWFYYGLRATSRRIKLDGGGSVVLFNANCCGGSGSSDRYVLLRPEPDGHFKNLLPEVIVSNQAEVEIWKLATASPMPVFVTADYLWGAMEGHYSDHFFEVQVYVYDASTDRYKMRHKYRTAHRYPGVDDWDSQPEVLEKERGRIVEMLGAQ